MKRNIHNFAFIGIFFLLIPTASSFAQSNLYDFLQENPSKYKDIAVEKVLSVDTIIIRGGEKIKLIGMRAPETPKKLKYVERDQFGFVVHENHDPNNSSVKDDAFFFVVKLLEKKQVRLEFDNKQKDGDFKTLAYIFLKENDLFVNAEILRKGYAYLQTRPPNTKYKKELREAYTEARTELRGLQNK